VEMETANITENPTDQLSEISREISRAFNAVVSKTKRRTEGCRWHLTPNCDQRIGNGKQSKCINTPHTDS
jgi:hypothetical protein